MFNYSNNILQGKRNAEILISNKKGWFITVEMWLNKNGIVNIISITKLGEGGYHTT